MTKKTWETPTVEPIATAQEAQNAVGLISDGGFLQGMTS